MKHKEFKENIFKSPPSEYRAVPFWAWNCKLDKDILKEQIDAFKEMGFGGFYMHPRCGMATRYLSVEYMEAVKACTQKAKQEGMFAEIYDEDRWPSGAAGGYVTEDARYCRKYLLFTAERGENPFACYDVVLNGSGDLERYKKISVDGSAEGAKWYAYIKTEEPTSWFNYRAYADILDKSAVDRFIDITYKKYSETVGGEFGKTIRTVFTDEPQMYKKKNLEFAKTSSEAVLSWTHDLDAQFKKAYNIDLTEHLPELIWNLPNGKASYVRYLYHDFTSWLFTENFAANCAKACEKLGLKFTGHMVDETYLTSQTLTVGDAMRALSGFHIPGIDMLCDDMELGTAKQAQSVARQYGRSGVMSELYGVTNWNFDFRGHKFQGDWQAALGVTLRVPSMAWASMSGISKRDYPGIVGYQTPWYKEYSYLENHYARLAYVLSCGKPIVKIGVIHPIESCWLEFGPEDRTGLERASLEESYKTLTEWLLYNNFDFDFINEALLPSQAQNIGGVLNVGEMSYSAIIVSGCKTLRKTTFDILETFCKNGGKLIFMGDCPKYIDAHESGRLASLYEKAIKANKKHELFSALEHERTVCIKNSDGSICERFFCNMRDCGEFLWLFLAHGKRTECIDFPKREDIIITVNGEFGAVLYDTFSGDAIPADYTVSNGKTAVKASVYSHDSLLIRLNKTAKPLQYAEVPKRKFLCTADFDCHAEYTLDEPNVCLLDMAEFSVDGGEFFPDEEIRKIDEKCIKILGIPDEFAQLWAIPEGTRHTVTLKFTINSSADIKNTYIAFEQADEVRVNGKKIPLVPDGYYVDKYIKKYPAGDLVKGKNIIEADITISRHLTVENFYLLGNFGVTVSGADKLITRPKEYLTFGSAVNQGLSFYGGNIRYKIKVNTPEGYLKIHANFYRGALIKVLVDGKDAGNIIFAPYSVYTDKLPAGNHDIELIIYGNRYNTFAGLHNATNDNFYSPLYWRTEGDAWCYEYRLKDMGIMSAPVISVFADGEK